MTKKFIFALLLIIIFPCLSFGQIVTPAFDQSVASESGIATSWRYFDSIGIVYETTTGTKKESDVKIGDTNGVLSGSNLILFFYMFGFELDGSASQTHVKNDVSTVDSALTKQNIFLSYRFNKYLALAIESLTTDFVFDQKTELTKIKADKKNTKIGLGATVRVGPVFLAYGSRNVSSTGSSDIDNTILISEKNSWQENYYGVAFILGTPDSTQPFLEYKMGSFHIHPALSPSQLRLEYAMVNSPEKRKDETETNSDNHHQKTEYTLLTAEAKWGSFLIHYKGETTTESPLSFQEIKTVESKDTKTTIGLAFIKSSSLTFGAYQTTGVMKSKIKSDLNVVESTTNSTSQMLTLGISF